MSENRSRICCSLPLLTVVHSAAEWTTLLAHWQGAKMLFVRYGPAAYFPRAVNYVIAVVEVTTCQFNIGSWIRLDNKHI